MGDGGMMAARVFFLPVRDLNRSAEEDTRLNAAVDWLLAEIDEPVSIESLRRLAAKEIARPRDALHKRWAQVFLEETLQFVS